MACLWISASWIRHGIWALHPERCKVLPLGQDSVPQIRRARSRVRSPQRPDRVAKPEHIAFLDPRVKLPRALALNTVLLALAALVATSIWRTRFEQGTGRSWRATRPARCLCFGVPARRMGRRMRNDHRGSSRAPPPGSPSFSVSYPFSRPCFSHNLSTCPEPEVGTNPRQNPSTTPPPPRQSEDIHAVCMHVMRRTPVLTRIAPCARAEIRETSAA